MYLVGKVIKYTICYIERIRVVSRCHTPFFEFFTKDPFRVFRGARIGGDRTPFKDEIENHSHFTLASFSAKAFRSSAVRRRSVLWMIRVPRESKRPVSVLIDRQAFSPSTSKGNTETSVKPSTLDFQYFFHEMKRTFMV